MRWKPTRIHDVKGGVKFKKQQEITTMIQELQKECESIASNYAAYLSEDELSGLLVGICREIRIDFWDDRILDMCLEVSKAYKNN